MEWRSRVAHRKHCFSCQTGRVGLEQKFRTGGGRLQGGTTMLPLCKSKKQAPGFARLMAWRSRFAHRKRCFSCQTGRVGLEQKFRHGGGDSKVGRPRCPYVKAKAGSEALRAWWRGEAGLPTESTAFRARQDGSDLKRNSATVGETPRWDDHAALMQKQKQALRLCALGGVEKPVCPPKALLFVPDGTGRLEQKSRHGGGDSKVGRPRRPYAKARAGSRLFAPDGVEKPVCPPKALFFVPDGTGRT